MEALRKLVLIFALAAALTACSYPDENFPGSEYMPDMAHSLALEANTYNYYYYNTWDDRSTVQLAPLAYPRVTVKGAIPRGYADRYLAGQPAPSDSAATTGAESMVMGLMVDNNSPNAIAVPTNGHVPFYFEDSPEGRLAAIAELQDNPFPITEQGLAKGANLYQIFCAICHGESGNGLGYIYDDEKNPNAAYPLAPANFLNAEFLAASNGRYYNAIYYGYNAMGAYKDKMNYEERWQVIHYIRFLQSKETGGEYSPTANTLNPAFGIPGNEFDGVAARRIADDDDELMTAAAVGTPVPEETADRMKKK